MDSNWCAFCLAILRPLEVDESLVIFDIEPEYITELYKNHESKYLDDKILKLREEKKTWKEISSILDITISAARNRASRAKERKQLGSFRRTNFSNEDIIKMEELLKNHTYTEVGLMFGTTKDVVYTKVKRKNKKVTQAPTKVTEVTV